MKKEERQKKNRRTANVPRGTHVTQSKGQLKTEIANVRLPERLAVKARRRAAYWGETMSEYVRRLIQEDLNHACRI